MATKNSGTNLITLTATGDTARTSSNLKIGNILVCGTSLTAAGQVQLMDAASQLYVIPPTKFKSGAGIFDLHFPDNAPTRIMGLKATICSNAQITVFLM